MRRLSIALLSGLTLLCMLIAGLCLAILRTATNAQLYSAGFAACAGVVTSSHNAAAERQFRTPLAYGGQRAPTAQWTVTGAGAFLLGKGSGVKVKGVCIGKPVDMGISDVTNMGAAMAPAACDTLQQASLRL